jgi:membrane fusion protein (multidrug efflux system)
MPSEEEQGSQQHQESGSQQHDAGAESASKGPAAGQGDAKPGNEEQKPAAGGPQGGDGKGAAAAPKRSRKPLIIVGIAVLVIGIVALIFWFLHRNETSTDDAYTDGNVVTMAPQVSGYVVNLYVDDNTHVRKGDLLVRIDPRDYASSQAQAEAQLAVALAQLKSAQDALRIARVQYPAQLSAAQAQQRAAEATFANALRQYQRQHAVNPLATTEESIDASTSQQLSSNAGVASARAQVRIASLVPEQIQQAADTVQERESQVKQAEAQLAQAKLNVGFTEIRAPSDGFITKRSVNVGDYLSTGTTMFLLVTPEVWVTANFKESQLGRMRVGDAVDMKLDAYKGYVLHGHVQSIQYGSGSRFSAFPVENATGNFVKIVQRIPVKIAIDRGLDPDDPLPLGLSVTPTVHYQ